MARRKQGEDFDAVDAKIMSLIQKDARMPNTAIAKEIGLSEAAVRKRIDRLVQEQIVSLTAHVDPLRIGFHAWALIQIETDTDKTLEAAQKIAEHHSTILVAQVTGDYDIYVVAVFRDTDELNTFLSEELRKIPGVSRTSTAYITKLIKRDFGFGVPIIEEFKRTLGESGAKLIKA